MANRNHRGGRRAPSSHPSSSPMLEQLEPRLLLSADFHGLGDLPGGKILSQAYGVSADGSVVVGKSYSTLGEFSNWGPTYEAFRWTESTGMQGLGCLAPGDFWAGSEALAISADGSVIAGDSSSAVELDRAEAFRWTESGGMQGLGDLPGGPFQSTAFGVSGDGAVVAGWSVVTLAFEEAFRWTESGGMQGLGALPGGVSSFAYGVSADGSVVVGNSGSTSGSQAFRWTESGGMQGLGYAPGLTFESKAEAVSADGSVVVGWSRDGHGFSEAFRWTESAGMQGLGGLPYVDYYVSHAHAVSADGSVVVGLSRSGTRISATNVEWDENRAFIWDETHGMRDLEDVLASLVGAGVMSGWTLTMATGISADGLTIVGYGEKYDFLTGDSHTEAWLARVAADPQPDLACIGPRMTALVCDPGDAVSIDFTTSNAGDAAAIASGPGYFDTALFLRADQDFDPSSSADKVSSQQFTTLDVGQREAHTYSFTAPTEPGTYYIRTMADSFNSVAESDEQNNWSHVITLTVNEPMNELVVGPSNVIVPEGGSADFTISLAAQPTADVTVNIGAQPSGDADLTADKDTLTFTPADWDQPQVVTVSAAEDSDTANGTGTFVVSSAGLASKMITATESDNDEQKLVVSTDTLSIPEGGSGNFTVRLIAQPTADVTVDVGAQPGGDADLTADKDTLTFTPADWDTPQVVTVDAIGDANGTGQVTLFVAGTLDQAVAVTVLPVNDKPVAYGQSATTDEDTSRLITLSGGDIETPAEELLYAVSRQAEHGTVSISDNRATYTPDSNYNGPDSFEFTVTDDGDPAGSHANPGDLTSDAAVVMITVNSVNDAPLASGQTLEMVDLNGPLDIHLTGSDTETPEDELVYEIVSPPTSGIASIIDNVVTYTPDPDWRGGQDALIYAVTDGGGLSDTAVVTIDVTVPGIWVTIAKGYRVSYTDGDGTVVKVVMNKDGQARVRFVGESLQQVATRKLWLLVGDDVRIVDIRLLNTTVRSSLTFKTKGGDRLASVGRIRGNTPLGKLSGKTIDLVGDGIQLTGGGYVGSIQLHDVKNGADIIMPGTGAAKGITIKAGVLYSDTDIVLGSYLKNLSAVQWVGSSLTAPWASSISIKGDRRNNVAGDFGADLTFTGADPKKGVALGKLSVAGTITDSVITAKSGSVGTIMAAQWDAGSLNATWAKNIMTKGNRRDSSITGDFGATLNLTGQDKRGMSLNKLQVAGKVVGSQITLAGAAGTIMAAQWDSGSLEALWAKTVMTKGKRADRKGAGGLVGDFGATLNLTGQDKRGVSLNKLQVAGTARNSTVRTAGSMGSILLGATDGSDFLAGIADTAGRHASGEADFVNPLAVIRSVKIKGWKVPKGEAASRFFVDSNFSAASLGTVNLLNVDYSNDDESFGLFALDQGIGKAIKSISARDTVTGERWKWPVVPVGGEIDFEIGVIY